MSTPAITQKALFYDLLLILMTAIWGSTFFMIKAVLPHIDPMALLFYRFGLASVLLLPYLLIKRISLRQGIGKGLLLGFLFWAMYASQTIGVQFTTATNSGFITALFVGLVPLFAIVLYGDWPTAPKLFAVVLALIGMWLLTGGIKGFNKGDVITLVAPVVCALYVLIADRHVKANAHPLVVTFQTFLVSAVLSLLWLLVFGGSYLVEGTMTFVVILYLAVFASIVTYGVYLHVQRHVSAMRVTLIFALEPVFAGLFAFLFLGEKLLGWQWAGAALIVVAMVVSGIGGRGEEHKSS